MGKLVGGVTGIADPAATGPIIIVNLSQKQGLSQASWFSNSFHNLYLNSICWCMC